MAAVINRDAMVTMNPKIDKGDRKNFISIAIYGWFLYRKAREGFAKDAKFSVFLALLAVPGVPCVTSLVVNFLYRKARKGFAKDAKSSVFLRAPGGSWRSLRYFPRCYFLYRKAREGFAKDAKSSVFLALLAVPGVPCVTSLVVNFLYRKAREGFAKDANFCIPCAPCGSWRSLRYFPCCYFLYRKARKGFAKPAKFSVFLALLAVPGVPCVTSLVVIFCIAKPANAKRFCIPCAPCGSWRSLRYFPRCYFLYRKARKGFAKHAKFSVFLALLALLPSPSARGPTNINNECPAKRKYNANQQPKTIFVCLNFDFQEYATRLSNLFSPGSWVEAGVKFRQANIAFSL